MSPNKKGRISRGSQYTDSRKAESVQQGRKIRQKKLQQQQRQKVTGLVRKILWTLVVIGILLALLSRTYIASFKVVTNGSVGSDRQTEVAEQYFDNFWHRIKFSFDEDDFARYMMDTLPDIYDIESDIPLWSNQLLIALESRAPALIWLDERRDQRYVIDQSGKAYAVASANQYPEQPLIVDQIGQEVLINQEIVAASLVSFIAQLMSTLKENNLVMDKIIIGEEQKQLRVDLLDRPYYLKVTTVRGAQEQVQDVIKAINHLKKTSVKYIDVRVEDKIFYR